MILYDILSKLKHEFRVAMITVVAQTMDGPILAVADSWFGNNGLWKPLHKQLGERFNMFFRLRSNQNLFDNPEVPKKARSGPGRPRKYGKKLGSAATLANEFRKLAREYSVNRYSRQQALFA